MAAQPPASLTASLQTAHAPDAADVAIKFIGCNAVMTMARRYDWRHRRRWRRIAMDLRLGKILIDHGLLTTTQSDRVIDEQQRTGEPFGVICERLFQVSPEAVEEAWAAQYASLSRLIDPRCEAIDSRAMELVTRRQAWQFRVLPLRFDGRELVMATTRQHLRRALRFATGVIGVPVFLVLAAPDALGEALCRHYPLPGMTPRSVNDGAMDMLLA